MKPTRDELGEILKNHALWLKGEGGSCANLSWRDISGANLMGVDLSWADLRGADLSDAILSGANLGHANLSWANLSGANLMGATNIPALVAAQTEILPRSGSFRAWKKCRNNALVELEIPSGAKRSNATGRKCRAEAALVLTVNGGITETAISQDDRKTEYIPGKVTVCDSWNPDRWTECGGGIHFFLTPEEAMAY